MGARVVLGDEKRRATLRAKSENMMGISDEDYPPATGTEEWDMRALRTCLKSWARLGWNTESIALGWFMARGYERDRARALAEWAEARSPLPTLKDACPKCGQVIGEHTIEVGKPGYGCPAPAR